MKEFFEDQIESLEPLTKETLYYMHIKKYHNGEDIKVGDKLLLAAYGIESVPSTTDVGWHGVGKSSKNDSFAVIAIREDHLHLYEEDDRKLSTLFPMIKLKSK